jgi:septal ring factor EnvC (AmiA/AmiB activator)
VAAIFVLLASAIAYAVSSRASRPAPQEDLSSTESVRADSRARETPTSQDPPQNTAPNVVADVSPTTGEPAPQATETQKNLADTEKKFNDLARAYKARDRELTALKAQLSTVQVELDAASRHSSQLQDEVAQAKAATAKVEKAKSDAERESAEKNAEIARLRTLAQAPRPPRSGILQWTGRARRGRLYDINGSSVSPDGRVTGVLPGVPCRIFPGNPDQIRIRTEPGPSNWSRLTFEPTANIDNATVVFFWVAN